MNLCGEFYCDIPQMNCSDYLGDVTSIELNHAKYDKLYVSTNSSLEQYSSGMPEWETDTNGNDITLIKTDFNNTCDGNRYDFPVADVSKLIIKRRKFGGTAPWLTVCEKNIELANDLVFVFKDFLCRTGKEYQYMLVPVIGGNEINIDSISTVKSSFYGVYFTDGKTQVGSVYDISSDYDNNTSSSTLMPIASKFPIVVQNGMLNYKTGKITTRFLKLLAEGKADDEGNYDHRMIINDFLSAGKALVFKNYDGFLGIVSIDDSISNDSGEYYLTPKTSISWTQIGDTEKDEELVVYNFVQQ